MIEALIGTGLLVACLVLLWLELTYPEEPDYIDQPASHAVAHAEGWPCSCPGRQHE